MQLSYTTSPTNFSWIAIAIALMALSGGVPSAYAQLLIDNPVIEMRTDEGLRSIALRNTGGAAVQVTLELEQVLSPATAKPYDEYTVPANRNGVKITPQTLEIPSHGSAEALVQRTLKELTTDEVYRLKVKPVRVPDSSPIVLNYDLLLLVRPKQAAPSISLKRTSMGMALVNQGNSNALLSSMQLCDLSIDDCQTLSTQRLYANERWIIPVPKHFDTEHLVLHAEQIHQNNRQLMQYQMQYDAKQPDPF